MPPGQARATPAHTPAHTPATQPSQPPAPRGRPEAPRQAQGGLPPPAPQGLDRPGALLCCPPAGDRPLPRCARLSGGRTNIWRRWSWSCGVSTRLGRATPLPAPPRCPAGRALTLLGWDPPTPALGPQGLAGRVSPCSREGSTGIPVSPGCLPAAPRVPPSRPRASPPLLRTLDGLVSARPTCLRDGAAWYLPSLPPDTSKEECSLEGPRGASLGILET